MLIRLRVDRARAAQFRDRGHKGLTPRPSFTSPPALEARSTLLRRNSSLLQEMSLERRSSLFLREFELEDRVYTCTSSTGWGSPQPGDKLGDERGLFTLSGAITLKISS